MTGNKPSTETVCRVGAKQKSAPAIWFHFSKRRSIVSRSFESPLFLRYQFHYAHSSVHFNESFQLTWWRQNRWPHTWRWSAKGTNLCGEIQRHCRLLLPVESISYPFFLLLICFDISLLSICLFAFQAALCGGYVNFGVFRLYGDSALDDALSTFIKMLMSIPQSDLLVSWNSHDSFILNFNIHSIVAFLIKYRLLLAVEMIQINMNMICY